MTQHTHILLLGMTKHTHILLHWRECKDNDYQHHDMNSVQYEYKKDIEFPFNPN